MNGNPTKMTARALCACLLILATLTAMPASAENFDGLDEEIQALKQEVIDLNRDLFLLEEELLFPSSTQVAVFVSMDVGEFFALAHALGERRGDPRLRLAGRAAQRRAHGDPAPQPDRLDLRLLVVTPGEQRGERHDHGRLGALRPGEHRPEQRLRLLAAICGDERGRAHLARLGLPVQAPSARVTVAQANVWLDSDVFLERSARFLRREALRGPATPVVLAERERLWSARPLVPALPAEL